MEYEKINELLGMKWSDVSEADKRELLAQAVVNIGTTSDPVNAGEEGIVDLVYPLSIAGQLSADGDIEIDDNAVIYNSEGDSYIHYEKTFYELRCETIELYSTKNIRQGIVVSQNGDTDPQIIKTFDTKEEALTALNAYHTEIRELSHHRRYWEVKEYYIEENTYDQDGEYVKGGDVWGISNITGDDIEKYNLNERESKAVEHDGREIK